MPVHDKFTVLPTVCAERERNHVARMELIERAIQNSAEERRAQLNTISTLITTSNDSVQAQLASLGGHVQTLYEHQKNGGLTEAIRDAMRAHDEMAENEDPWYARFLQSKMGPLPFWGWMLFFFSAFAFKEIRVLLGAILDKLF